MRKSLLLSLLALMNLPVHAVVLGGNSDGGGNSVDNRMIEEFQIAGPEQLKGYQTFRTRVEELGLYFPVFKQIVDLTIPKKVWYLIPREFDELPASQTGLNFTSEQPAYQNDREIFVSSTRLNSLSERSAGIKIMHEVLMASQEVRDVTKVRLANGKIFAAGATLTMVQDALAENDFGVHFTPAQRRRFREAERLNYMTALMSMLQRAGSNSNLCIERNGALEQHLRSTYPKRWRQIRLDMFRANLIVHSWPTIEGEPISTYKGPNGGPDYLNRKSNMSEGYHGYYSPFRPTDMSWGLYMTHADIRARSRTYVRDACSKYPDEFGKKVCDQFRVELRLHDEQMAANVRNNTHPTGIREAMENDDEMDMDAHQVRMALARRNGSFARLIALVADDEDAIRNGLQQFSWDKGVINTEAQRILDEALSIRRSLRGISADERFRMGCADAMSLESELRSMIDALNGKKKNDESKVKFDSLPSPF